MYKMYLYYPFIHCTTVSYIMCYMYIVHSGMQEWVIQIPSIPILVSFPSLHLRIKIIFVTIKTFSIIILLLAKSFTATSQSQETLRILNSLALIHVVASIVSHHY